MKEAFPGLNDVITKTIGLFSNLELDAQLKNSVVEISPNLSIVTTNSEKMAINHLSEVGEINNKNDISSTYLKYAHDPLEPSRLSFDALEVFENFCLTVRLATGKKCECSAYISCNEKIKPDYYYKPFIISNFNDLWILKTERATIKDLTEINTIKSLFLKVNEQNPAAISFEYPRLCNALKFFNMAYSTKWFLLKIVHLFTVLESIFSENPNEIAYKISLRTAYLLHPDDSASRKKVFGFLKQGYDIRSRFLHGNKINYANKEKQLQNILGVQHYSLMFKYPEDLYDIVRRVINKIITNETIYKLLSEQNEELYISFLNDIALNINE